MLNAFKKFLRDGLQSTQRTRRSRRRKHGVPFQHRVPAEALETRALLTASLENFLTTEHVDINLQRSGTEWSLGPRNSDIDIQYANDEVVLYAGAPSILARPAGSDFDFIGVDSGENFYMLPANQDPELLYLGFAAYGLDNTVDRYNAATESKGRASGNARYAKASLSEVRHTNPDGTAGSGEFSMWQSGSFGGAVVFMSSFNDGVANANGNGLDATDGIAADDAMWIVAGGHSHYNFGFTQPGRYEVDLKLSAYFGDDGSGPNAATPNLAGFSQSEDITIYFSVISVGQLQFDASTYSVNEGAGTASIDVVRVGGSDGRINVNYATNNGTATAGNDYASASGTLEFLDGETRRTITVPIQEDVLVEGDETFNVVLSAPTPTNLNDYIRDVEGDANGLIGTIGSAVVTIVDNDVPPTISDINNKTTPEDVPTGAIPFTVGDDTTPASSLVVTATSSNTTLVPNGNIVLGGSGANRTVTITPALNQFGSTTITLTVTDETGLTATDTFVLNVTSVNDLPTISDVGNQSIDQNTATGAIAFTVGDVETAAGALAVTATSSNTTLVPNGNIVIGGSGANRTVTVTPATNQTGSATITLTVTDGDGESSTDTFVVNVNAVNSAPTISDVGNQSTNEDTATGAIAFTVGDGETAAGSLVVTATSSNTTLVPNGNIVLGGSGANRTVTITPAANLSGTTTITLTVTDEGGLTATDTFVLTVGGVNDPPTISDVDNQSTDEDTATGAIFFTVGDAETAAGSLVVTATSSNTTLVPNDNIVLAGTGANRTVTITPAANQFGNSTITLTVTDEGGLVATDTFVLNVASVNDLPTISDIGNQSTQTATTVGPISFTIGDEETAAAALTVTAESSNTTLLPLSGIVIGGSGANRSVTLTPAVGQTGVATVTLTVTDANGGSRVDTFELNVSPNSAPTISDITNRFVVEGASTGAIAFTVGDVETAATDLVVTATSSNTTVVPNANIVLGGSGANRTLTITPAAAQVGPTTITITVTDAGGLHASDTFVLTVVANHAVPFTTPNFQDPNVTSSGSAQLADLNSDGKLDLVTSAGGYLLGVGDGTFQPRQDLPDSEGLRNDIVAVDYDGDGDLDLLVSKPNATDTTTDTLMLFRNNGSASFTAVPLVTLPRLSTQLEAGDFNGDGRVDVVYGKATTTVAYALQQPDGSLGTEVVLPVTTTTSTVKVADIDADGDVDIVVGNRTGSNAGAISVFKKSGSGTFSLAQAVATGNFPTVLKLTDMNGDGRMDIVSTQLIANTRVGWYPQAADGTFGARVNVMTAISQLNSVEVSDVNEDGVPDIVAAANTLVGSTLTFTSVWSPGLGGGAYGNPILLDPNQGNSTAVFVADLDGDAHPDIIATGNSDSTKPSAVRILINKTGENPMVLTPPAARTRVGGDPIELSVYFGFPINVTGTPRIALALGGNTVYANYVSGSGTGTLTFRYTVASTDMDLDGVQLACNVIQLNGGTLTDPVGGAAALEFPNLPFSGVIVNAAGPLVQSITRLDSQTTTAGTVRFNVQFAEAVTGVDAADFTVRMIEGNLAGAVITGLTGSGSLYEVTVSTGTGSGTLGLSVNDGASINDLNGDVLAKGYAGGQVYTVRKQPVAPSNNYYTDGHADYRPVHDNGEFSYVWHGDPGVLPQIEYSSEEVISYLDSTSIVTRPAGANYDFIGVGANQPFYLSNSSGNIASVPFLGWSGESLIANDFADYRPTEDPRITSATLREYVKVQMVGFRSDSGGDFSLYSGSTPTVWFATSDGISSTDNIWLYRTHFHRETAFSKPGTYEIDVVISGYLDGNANNALDATDIYVESGIKTMVFHVDTLGAINDSFNVVEGNTLNGNVSSNDDWHASMGAYAASVETGPANGTLTLNANGTFTYQPNAGFAGPDSFVYRLTNERGGFTKATASITVVANRAVPFALPTYFGGEVSTSVGSSAAADLNGDGKIDLVYGGPSGTPLRWAAGTGSGGFLPEQGITVGLGLGTNAVTTVDYDGDGDIDVLSVDTDSATQGGTASNGMVSLYRNDGTGQFTRSLLIPTGLKQIPKLAVGDLNKDGRPDLVYSSTRPGSPQQQDAFYALQLPSGELGTPTKFADYVMELQIADVNGDGNLDIVGGRVRTDYAYSVYYGDGTGNFGTPQTFTTGGVVGVFEVSDVTGDGRPDIVTTDTASGQRGLALYTQNADGTFAPRVGLPLTFTTAGTPAVKVTDVNRDSVPDLLVYGNVVGGASASWLPGLGGGAFGNPVYLYPGATGGSAPVSRGLHFFDVDGDTYSDIVAVGPTSSSIPKPIAVFLNKTGEDPRVVFPPTARTRLAGEQIDFQIYFGFPIAVTGSPRIALDLNGSTVYANYFSGTGRPTLTFRYTVGSTDVDLDGVQLASSTIDLNGGTMTDPAGQPIALTFPATPFSGVVVNALGPLVLSVTRLDSAATTASTVRFAVQFSESVTGVDAADFVARTNDGNLTGAAVEVVTGSGSLYEVTVSTGTGSGVLGLTVQGSSITGVNGASFSRTYVGGEVYTVRPQSPSDFATYYTSGHADYRPVYENGEVDFVLHASPGVLPQIEYPSEQVVTYLDSTSIVTRGAGANFDFLGVAAGQMLYLSNAAGSIATVPYLGFSGESLNSIFIGNTTTQLVGFRSSSGGQFSIYTSSGAVRMATSDGITAPDKLTIQVGSHAHYNTAFSKAGTYEVDVVVSGYLDSNANGVYDTGVDAYVESGIQTMVFHVDTLGAVNDSFNFAQGSTLTGSVAWNDDWHASMGVYTASVQTTTTKGTLSLQPNGSFTYQPSPAFDGSDSFTYRVTNERGGFTTATVTITGADLPDFEAVLSEGHADIGVALGAHDHDGGGGGGDHEDPEWDLHVHDEETDTEYHPDEVLLYVGMDAITTRPADPAYNFTGVAGGEKLFVLPEAQNPGLLFLGFGAEEITDGTLQGGSLAVRLKSVSGPGHFSLWSSAIGGPNVAMATFDGITQADLVTLLEGGHSHFNFGFTEMGMYQITFQAIGTLADGDVIVSDDVTYFFKVGNTAEAIDVQNGMTQRSYIRDLDVLFASDDGLDDILANPGRVQITKFDLNGSNGSVLPGSAFGLGMSGNRLTFDFGLQGLGGNRNTNAGDGYYRVGIDADGDGEFETFKSFYRLLGDVNGDRKVDAADRTAVMNAMRSQDHEMDTNGDGVVNSADLSLVTRAIGRKLKDDLFADD